MAEALRFSSQVDRLVEQESHDARTPNPLSKMKHGPLTEHRLRLAETIENGLPSLVDGREGRHLMIWYIERHLKQHGESQALGSYRWTTQAAIKVQFVKLASDLVI